MDFAQLREAVDPANSPPALVAGLPRELVLQLHQRAIEREVELDKRGEVRTRKMVISGGKHFSNRELKDLDPMDLRGEVLCNRPAMAIKEPLLRESGDGFLVRVDSPTDLVRLFPSSPFLKGLNWPSPPPGSASSRTALQLKDEGNRLFALRKWRAALEPYSLGVDLEPPGKLAGILRSNRAATYLKLEMPGAALRDCDAALADPALDAEAPLRRKVLFRAASAEYQLQRFSAANSRLETLLDLYPEDADAMDLYRRTQVRLVEATRGEFDWPFLFEAARTSTTLDIASFTGSMMEPVEISGRGRGLVATRDIERGELLLVAKPFAMGAADRTRKKYTVGANLFTSTVDPYATVDLAALVIEKLVDDPSTHFPSLFNLHPGSSFTSWVPSTTSIDPSRLEAIITYNAFHTESLSQKSTGASPAEDRLDTIHAPSSIYHTPSFLNHACVGNCSYSFLADVLFLRARRSIPRGVELVDSYVDSMTGLERRQDVLSKHSFVCTCELCTYDLYDGPAQNDARAVLAETLEKLTDHIHGAEKADPTAHLTAILSLVERIQKTYAVDRVPLKPALYPAFRLLAQTYAGMGKEWAEAAVRTEIKAMQALGAVFGEGEDDGSRKLLEEAKVGDVNAVLSALFVASQMGVLGKPDGVQHWIDIARRTEAGQAGEPLFRVRYAEWAEKHGLDLGD
ncbi:hypothetical protein RQP46_003489 [Phenoliferia psychrophenolica]